MLDQMSGGRLEIGFGRGASPIEIEYLRRRSRRAQEIYAEGVELILKGLTSKTLDFHGKHFTLRRRADGARAAAKAASADLVRRPCAGQRRARGASATCMSSASIRPATTRLSIERYRATWRPPHARAPRCRKLGLGRFIVVAETDAEALALARRAYPIWHHSFTYLFRLRGRRKIIRGPPISTR